MRRLRSAADQGARMSTRRAGGPSRGRRRLTVVIVVLLSVIVAAWSQVDAPDRVDVAADGAMPAVSIIAHAGAQGHAPPNTMPAFGLALELGADTLEMDLQLTADGEVVTIHDGTVDRTTDGSGAVGDLTLTELQALDAGATWTPPEQPGADPPFAGQGVRHASLREVLDRFPETPLVVEL